MTTEHIEGWKLSLRDLMAGNGVLMIFAALVGGLGYWMFLLGGFEIVPGFFVSFQLPGTEHGWRGTHTGPVLNGLMTIAVAFVIPHVNFSEKWGNIWGWIVMLDGWSNVLFYWGSNFAPNRALAFGDTPIGPSNIFSFIGLAPAYVFGVLNMIALVAIGRQAIIAAKARRSGSRDLTTTRRTA